MILSDFEFRRDILYIIASYKGSISREVILNGYYSIVVNELNFDANDIRLKTEKILNSSRGLVLSDLAINGRDLQIHYPELKGRALGDKLKNCLEAVWENPEKNTKNSLLELSG